MLVRSRTYLHALVLVADLAQLARQLLQQLLPLLLLKCSQLTEAQGAFVRHSHNVSDMHFSVNIC